MINGKRNKPQGLFPVVIALLLALLSGITYGLDPSTTLYWANHKTGECNNTDHVPEMHPDVVETWFRAQWGRACKRTTSREGKILHLTLACWTTTYHYFTDKAVCQEKARKLHAGFIREWGLPAEHP